MKLILITLTVSAMLYATVSGAGPLIDSRAPAIRQERNLRRHPTLIFLNRGAVDTSLLRELDSSKPDLRVATLGGQSIGQTSKRLRIVQFPGPIEPAWMRRLEATGCTVISYLPNYAYIVRGSARQIADLAGLEPAADNLDGLQQDTVEQPIRWMAPFQPVWKIDPVYSQSELETSDETASIQIELIDHPALEATESRIAAIGAVVSAKKSFSKFTVLTATAPIFKLVSIASLDDVLYVERAREPMMLDERADQIAAGNLVSNMNQPVGPGYLAWLTSLGLNTSMDFAIEFSDSGLDRGSASASTIHPDFLDQNGLSRVAYLTNYVPGVGAVGNDTRGHGTLVASIAAGYPNVGVDDPDGYQLGTGSAPFATIGASKIFDTMGAIPPLLNLSNVMSAAYKNGARIANESWGQSGNQYDIAAQQFDILTRDCQSTVDGNQEMTFVFAAGNEGPGGHVDSPGTAKNAITVGASENYRPQSFDTCNLDGQGALGPDASDNALDLLRFSSGGPTDDGRSKPDLVAPGTHIYGARSQDPNYNAAGLCPGFPIYGTALQQGFYVSSSGTSLSTPVVSGAAALIRQYFVKNSILPQAAPPSPALIKAYLVNSADRLTGEYTDDGGLPGARQGWGLIDLSRGFDSTPRMLVDQSHLFTASGQTFQINGSISDRSKPLRITLAWTDAPGTPVASPWVNDLDLELTVGGSTVYLGNNFSGQYSVTGGSADGRNNLECIFIAPDQIPEGVDGNFTVTVRAANIAGDGVPGNGIDLDQDFALVVYNITAPVVPPPRIDSVTYSAKVLTITGAFFASDASVMINGSPVNIHFSFDHASNSLSARAKPRKLNLMKKGSNQIVVTEEGRSSQIFTLQL